MKRLLSLPLICISVLTFAQNRFSNDLVMKVIYTHQNEHNVKAIYPYLHSPVIKYREAACMAFASLQDSSAVDSLIHVVRTDISKEVIKAGIYSLGQLRLESVGIKLISLYGDKQMKAYKPELLMAIGKCAKTRQLFFFNSIECRKSDTALQKAYIYACTQAYRRSKSIRGDAAYRQVAENLDNIYKNIQSPDVKKYYFYLSKTFLKPEGQNDLPIVRKDEMPKMYGHYDDFITRLRSDSMAYVLLAQLEFFRFSEDEMLGLALNDTMPLVVRSKFAELYFAKQPHPGDEIYDRFLKSKDLALIGTACDNMLRDTAFMESRGNLFMEKLKRIQAELPLPREFEAWVETEKVLCVLEGRDYGYKSWFELSGYSNPIDWKYVSAIPANQRLRITTNKGSIVMVCKVDDAPASVSSFLKLVDSGYYNGKYFHRMVSDFVVQGGCPRGDGWGSLDYSLRSEFSNYLRYKPGSVGLASAGKDSEGVQFFITHTYTCHLDGRYTIFAEVEMGMEVVNLLKVGDRILKIERI